MKTLIIPCAGKSNRFPNMKPKWMLTHPDGQLMIEKALQGFDTASFDRIIITIVRPHIEKYEAELVLKQVFKNTKIELCVLDDFTASASETIMLTLDKMNVAGAFVIKDSDNRIYFDLPQKIGNCIVGYDLTKHHDVSNIPGKSFLIANEQNIITDIVEKKIVSDMICLGVYAFENADDFRTAYREMHARRFDGEMYISHVISYMLSKKDKVFYAIEATGYDDWGTLKEWKEVQRQCRTYFVDVDGVLMQNCGRYGSLNWYNNDKMLVENCAVIKRLQDEGAQIVITTSRTEEFRADLVERLARQGIHPYAIVMGMNHAARVVVNDFAPTNPYPSGLAVTFPRNGNLKEYL